MTSKTFRFNEAAKLYVENLEILRQIREETYHNITEFSDNLISALQNELGDEHLCQKNTNMQGAYFGAEIRYLWIGMDNKEWDKVASVYFVVPILGKITNDILLANVFDVVKHNRIKFIVNYIGVPKKLHDSLASLALKEELGELISQKAGEFSIWIKFDQSDPITSASKKVAVLLKAIKAAQNSE